MKRIFGFSKPVVFGIDSRSSVSSARIGVPASMISINPLKPPVIFLDQFGVLFSSVGLFIFSNSIIYVTNRLETNVDADNFIRTDLIRNKRIVVIT